MAVYCGASNHEAGLDAFAVEVETAGQTRIQRMEVKQQERAEQLKPRVEQAQLSAAARDVAKGEASETTTEAKRGIERSDIGEVRSTNDESALFESTTTKPAPTARSPQLPWWYRWSYRMTIAGYTFALVMYGVGCLLLLGVVFAVVAIIVL